jgi:hypothetical protein
MTQKLARSALSLVPYPLSFAKEVHDAFMA